MVFLPCRIIWAGTRINALTNVLNWMQSSHDVMLQLQSIGDANTLVRPTVRQRFRLAWLTAAIVLTAVVTGLLVSNLGRTQALPERDPTRFAIELSSVDRAVDVSLAVSPSGTGFVYVGTSNGVRRLFLRSWNALEAEASSGHGGSATTFFLAGRHLGRLLCQRTTQEGTGHRRSARRLVRCTLSGTWELGAQRNHRFRRRAPGPAKRLVDRGRSDAANNFGQRRRRSQTLPILRFCPTERPCSSPSNRSPSHLE